MHVVAFLIHALGERDANHGMARGDNIQSAHMWFRLLKESTRWAICYPTTAYLASVDELAFMPGMLVDHREMMLRCDVLVATGGVMSPHMRFIWDAAKRSGKPLLDLLDLGAMPPLDLRDETKREIQRRADALDLD